MKSNYQLQIQLQRSGLLHTGAVWLFLLLSLLENPHTEQGALGGRHLYKYFQFAGIAPNLL